MIPQRTWIGVLQTDHWDRPIVDGWSLDLSAYVGKRVEIVIRDVGTDPESYEALAQSFERRNCHPGKAPAAESTHSVSRPPTAEAEPILYPPVRDV